MMNNLLSTSPIANKRKRKVEKIYKILSVTPRISGKGIIKCQLKRITLRIASMASFSAFPRLIDSSNASRFAFSASAITWSR